MLRPRQTTRNLSSLGTVLQPRRGVGSGTDKESQWTRSPLGPDQNAPARTETKWTPVTKVGKPDPIWSSYVKEAQIRDKEMLDVWSNNMDVLLVFAGLFSAIVTAFLIEVSRDLQPDPTDTTHDFLRAVVQRLDFLVDNGTSPITPLQPTAFKVSSQSVRINFYWFASLTFSLLAAAGAMLAKQWLWEYSRDSNTGSQYDQAHLRQERYDGLETWRFRDVVNLLPTLIYIALALFFMGLIDFLWGRYRPFGIFILIIFVIGITFVALTTGFALYFPNCPYRIPLTRHTPPARRSEVAEHQSEHDDLKPLLWILQESRSEETVRSSLKLIPAVTTSPARRDQIRRLGAVTRICELFETNHPDYARLVGQQSDIIAFGLALRALLAVPRPSLPRDILNPPLRLMSNHSNINLRILAVSLLEPDVAAIDLAQGIYSSIPEPSDTQAMAVEPWARILFLEVLREQACFIRTCADPIITRQPRYSAAVILNEVADVGSSAPSTEVDRNLLASLLRSMAVTLGGEIPDRLGGGLPTPVTYSSLGLYLATCLDRMKLYKSPTREPSTPKINHTNTVILPPDIELALLKLLSVINQLLPRHPQLFGASWPFSIGKLIDLSDDSSPEDADSEDGDGDSQSREVVNKILKTMLLCGWDTLKTGRSPKQIKQLLRICLDGPYFDDSAITPDRYFLNILKLMEHLLPAGMETTCAFLLEKADTFAEVFMLGLRERDNTDIHDVILRIIDFLLSSSSYSDIHDKLVDQLVVAGLLDAMLALMQRSGQGPRQGLRRAAIAKSIGWLGRSSKAAGCLTDPSSLNSLLEVMQDTGSVHGQGSAARAIMILWNSAKSGPAEAYQDITRRVIESGFLSTLSRWFEKDIVGEHVYQSDEEIQSIWIGLFQDVLDIDPSALVGSSPASEPKLLSAMSLYFHRRQSSLSGAAHSPALLQGLQYLENGAEGGLQRSGSGSPPLAQ